MAKGKKPGTSSTALHDRIVEWFEAHPTESCNYLQLSQEFGIYGRTQRTDVYHALVDLLAQDFLKESSPGRFKLAARRVDNEQEGIFTRRSNGIHSVTTDGGDTFTIYDGNDMRALTGDRVRFQAQSRPSKAAKAAKGGKPGRKPKASAADQQPEARVVEVVERAPHRFVGTVQRNGNYIFVIPDNRALDKDFYVREEDSRKCKDGDKVVIDFKEWPAFSRNPFGAVVDILGKTGDNTTEMHAILAEYGLPYKYPESPVRAANRIADGCTDEEIARRLDMRDVTTFTIDPRDAKDFDDALSLRKLPNGHWEAGVHIADVTYYVHPDTVIDREAYSRATSVYLVDRTIPMLPERLCNELCSLRQDEEKLAFSVIFEMDDDANVVHSNICRTAIRSNRRFTYEEAQEIIETGKGDFAPEVLALDRLAKQLRARRFAEGAIAFDRVEVKFEIDDKGKPVSVYFKESKDANKLVEEFMLLANRTVAEAIGKVTKNHKAKTFVYRVHDKPTPERLESLADTAARFGHKLNALGSNRELSQGINRLMKDIHNRPEENLLSTLAVRSMAKAVYSTENIGHYGLAFDYYTHFTSPIRRYPDMMVHRLLDRYLAQGGRSVPAAQWEEYCKHSSDMEQLAASAERASIKYKQAEYLSERLGQTFEGIISGVTEWGFYVELNDNKCEGMVPVRDLKDDHYIFDEKNFCLIGRSSHRRFTLGDKVQVQVASVNMERKTVDFALIEDSGSSVQPLAPMPRRKGGRRRK
jgi:ribonuclease R